MSTYEKIDLQLKEIDSTRKEMCRVIGVSYNTIASLYQRQSENISLEVLRAISRYLNVSLDYLIFEDVEIQDSVNVKIVPPSEDGATKKSSTPDKSETEEDKDKIELLEYYDSMNQDGQKELVKHARQLTYAPEYKKCASPSSDAKNLTA